MLQNHSFETPTVTNYSGTYDLHYTGDNIGGWFVTQHVSDVGHIRHYPAIDGGALSTYPDGDQMMYIGDSGDAGAIVQPIATPLNAGNYELSFYQGVMNFNQMAEVRIQLAPITGGSGFGTTYGAPVYNEFFTVGGPGSGIDKSWHLRTDVVTVPSAGSYGLFIIGAADGGLPTLVDNVSLSVPEVPEPASIAMFAVAGLFMFPIRRRRYSEL